MTLQEAKDLAGEIALSMNSSAFQMKRLSGKDWCIVMTQDGYYLWGIEDWEKYQRTLAKRRVRMQKTIQRRKAVQQGV